MVDDILFSESIILMQSGSCLKQIKVTFYKKNTDNPVEKEIRDLNIVHK